MKYKHEFAVKHLPMTVIGGLIETIGITFLLILAFDTYVGDLGGKDLVYALIGCVGAFIGGLMLADGIEYTHKLAPVPVDPPVTKKETEYKTVDQRREEVLAYDFSTPDATSKAAEKSKKDALKKSLLS